MIATFAFGIGFYGVGVYLVVLHDRLGWPISLISLAITGYYVLSATMITFVGDAFDDALVLIALVVLHLERHGPAQKAARRVDLPLGDTYRVAQRMRRGQSLLEPRDMQHAAFRIHLGEYQPAGLRHA